MESFGDRLSLAIKKAGLTKVQLAEKLNTTPTTIYRWEKGINETSDTAKIKLAAALNVSVAYLMGESESENNNCLHIDIIKKRLYAIPMYKYSKLTGEAYPTMKADSSVDIPEGLFDEIDPQRPPFAVEQDTPFRMKETANLLGHHIALVNPVVSFASGKVFLAAYNGHSYIRRVYDNPDGSYELVCDGERQIITAANAQAGHFAIVGKVVKRLEISDVD